MTSHIVKGVFIALIFILIDLLIAYTPLKNYTISPILLILLYFILCFINVVMYNRQTGNTSTGNAFVYGFKTVTVVCIIMIAYRLIYLSVLFPEMKQLVYIAEAKNLAQQGNTLPGDIEKQAHENVNKSFYLSYISIELMRTVIIGTVGSFIGALFTKKVTTN